MRILLTSPSQYCVNERLYAEAWGPLTAWKISAVPCNQSPTPWWPVKFTDGVKYPVCFPNSLTPMGKLVTRKPFPEHALSLGTRRRLGDQKVKVGVQRLWSLGNVFLCMTILLGGRRQLASKVGRHRGHKERLESRSLLKCPTHCPNFRSFIILLCLTPSTWV